ncbi:MAG: diguanylate cyclase [Gammaproteobacteria bacterium]|nr:diguanylate cyclase [Gammaproteobacteria bacterium]
MKILLVDDTKTDRLIMSTYLSKMGHDVVLAENGVQAVSTYKEVMPDLLVMDVIMPEMDGYEAAQNIRKMSDEWIPIIFLSARIKSEDIIKGIEAGGDDYLTKPIDHRVLAAKMKAMQRIAEMRHKLIDATSELQSVNKELKELVNLDGLTRLANRRYLDEFLKKEISRAIRHKLPITVILADVDHFKTYNDNYGHLAGDDCLKAIAHALKQVCRRPTDLVARYGGEEFAIILPDTQVENSMFMAEKLRSVIEALGVTHDYSTTSNVVTMSLGVCSLVPEINSSTEELLKKADDALYSAKKAGRNQAKSAS